MGKTYKVRFCVLRKHPITIMYDEEYREVQRTGILLQAKTQPDLLKRLKGTDYKVVADIKSIKECTR